MTIGNITLADFGRYVYIYDRGDGGYLMGAEYDPVVGCAKITVSDEGGERTHALPLAAEVEVLS